jgi:small subunit ribosomal protein S1
LKKEDGSNAKVDETLDFVVIEFNKDAKKIIVSHTRTFEEGTDKPAPAAKAAASKAPKVAQNIEKSTLGDLDALTELKKSMEEGK